MKTPTGPSNTNISSVTHTFIHIASWVVSFGEEEKNPGMIYGKLNMLLWTKDRHPMLALPERQNEGKSFQWT